MVQLQAEKLQTTTSLGSENSLVSATLQNKDFPSRKELTSCYQSNWTLSKIAGNLGDSSLSLCWGISKEIKLWRSIAQIED